MYFLKMQKVLFAISFLVLLFLLMVFGWTDDDDDDDGDDDDELFCCMIFSWDHCQRSSPSRISDTLHA